LVATALLLGTGVFVASGSAARADDYCGPKQHSDPTECDPYNPPVPSSLSTPSDGCKVLVSAVFWIPPPSVKSPLWTPAKSFNHSYEWFEGDGHDGADFNDKFRAREQVVVDLTGQTVTDQQGQVMETWGWYPADGLPGQDKVWAKDIKTAALDKDIGQVISTSSSDALAFGNNPYTEIELAGTASDPLPLYAPTAVRLQDRASTQRRLQQDLVANQRKTRALPELRGVDQRLQDLRGRQSRQRRLVAGKAEQVD
jgi:hypothetical protein